MLPVSANDVIEAELEKRCRAVEGLTGGHVLLLRGPMLSGVDLIVRDVVEARVQATEPVKRLIVLLTTDGGVLEPVRRIVDVFRRYYEVVDFVIPDHAFSAGTILAMSGDSIWMDYFSRLGPIDPQWPKNDGRMVPALGYLEKWEEFVRKAHEGTLTTAELQVMLQFDQAELHLFEEAKQESVSLLEEWLVKYKFKNWERTQERGEPVTLEMKQRRAREIGENLNDTKKWHSHGFGISREVLQRDVKLMIDDLDLKENRMLRDTALHFHRLTEDYMVKTRANGRVQTGAIGRFY